MILITGGTGAMGHALVRRLAGSGKQLRVFTLPHDPNVSRVTKYNADVQFGDIAHKDDLQGICENVKTVYHLAAVIITPDEDKYRTINIDGTKNLVHEAEKSQVEHFIHISSASVTYPQPTTYSLSKQASEEIVRNSKLNFTIIRPTLVYGRTGGEEFESFLSYLNTFPILPFIGKGAARKRPVFVGDIINGLLYLCDNKKAYGKVYNFSGGEVVSMLEFARLCMKYMNIRKPILPLPVWFCSMLADFLALFIQHPPLRWPVIAGITQDADLDPREAMEDLGYDPVKVSEQLPKIF